VRTLVAAGVISSPSLLRRRMLDGHGDGGRWSPKNPMQGSTTRDRVCAAHPSSA
jgi:hypothetical protein